MDVSIINATPSPLHVISQAAGICYGKNDYSFNRVRHCFNHHHMSPFEHATATFLVSGISRACSHQLVRHRLASYNQQSQRYCKIDVHAEGWYVMPPSYSGYMEQQYRRHMTDAALWYLVALESGIKPEDARYLLPEACKTEIVVSMNVRELFHFLDERQSPGAQWEIHELADAMEEALRRCGDAEWLQLMEMRSGAGHEI